jgi:SAM-dependent methyltransferase
MKLGGHFDVIGVDISDGQLELARKNVPSVDFRLADMSTLDFPDETFDAIVSYYAIFHLPREEHPALLANFRRMLKADGYLLISLGTSGGVGIEEDRLGGGAPMYWSNFDTAANIKMVEDARFDIIWHRLVAEILIEEGDDPEDVGHHLFILGRKRASR